MNRIAVVFLTLLMSACASMQSLPIDYSGPDAGKVVIGMGAATGTSYSYYSLLFRRVGQQQVGRIVYFQTNVVYAQTPDYENSSEKGVVLVPSLPAGDYEIFNFDVFYNGGIDQVHFSSRKPFSIPFSVMAGKTTYLGNYQANAITGKNILGLKVPAGAVFDISNRSQDDLRLARVKDALVSAEPNDATPPARGIGNPFFVEHR